MPPRETSSLLHGLPGCIFSNGSPRTVFGAEPGGRLVHVSQVPDGAYALVCPDCASPLIARRGEQRVWHFAHIAAAECRRAGETALHRMAKEIISESMSILLPAFEVDTGVQSLVVQQEREVTFDRIDEEVPQEGFRPDLLATLSANGKAHRLLIEVYVTHRVDEVKLARLRRNGVSVIEIDLSRVGRTLSGVELKELILRAAPRRWLVHRAEERLQRKAFRMETAAFADHERRRKHAIAMEAKEDAERQAAKKLAPTIDDPRLQAAAGVARRNWSFLDMEELFNIPAADGIFDVPRDVWRGFVLSPLSPWRKEPYVFGFRVDVTDFARQIGMEMREKGWVKSAFARPLTTFRTGRREDWDPVCDAIRAFLVDGLGRYGFATTGAIQEVYIDKARRSMALGWRDGLNWAGRVCALVEELAIYEVSVSLARRALAPGVTIEEILEVGTVRSAGGAVSLLNILHEIQTGMPRFGTRHDAAFFRREGISLSCPGDHAEGATERALAHVQEDHRSRWRGQLDALVARRSAALLASLRDLDRRGLFPHDLAVAAGFGDLLSEAHLRARLTCLLPVEGSDPFGVAKAHVDGAARCIEVLGQCLEAVAQIAEASSSPALADLLRREGAAASFALTDRFGGAYDVETFARAAEAVATLERIGSRYGYGEEFAMRALTSIPPGAGSRLVELMFDPACVVPFRKALNDVISRQRPLPWIMPSM